MTEVTLRHFKYEIALGAVVPMPKPAIDYYPHDQFSVQQYLRTLCKDNVGSLGKSGGKWAFGPDCPESVRLSSRPDIVQMFNFAEELGMIEPKGSEGEFTVYELTATFQTKFDKFS